MLGRSELELLLSLRGEQSLKEVAESVGLSESYVSETVSGLEGKGLVDTRREGRRKLVSPAGNRAVELLRDVGQLYPHVDFPEMLQGEALSVLYSLDGSKSVAEVARETGNYRNTVHRILKRLQARGIVRKEGSRYGLNPDFEVLRDFAAAYVHLRHRRKVPGYVGGFVVIWEDLERFLVKTEGEIEEENFLETGPGVLSRYGLPMLTGEGHFYIYSEERDRLEPPDLVCHLLLIDAGTRGRRNALLLILKEGVEEKALIEAAENYGVGREVEELIAYLDTEGETVPQRTPDWGDFQRTAEEYGVEV